jgi:outer membrane protein TolC
MRPFAPSHSLFRSTVALAMGLPLALAPSLDITLAPHSPPPLPLDDPCLEGAVTPIGLRALWSEAREREPALAAGIQRVAAGDASRAAVRREWFPTFQIEGLGNYGQRLSPGEERALGVGARGELRLLGSWNLLDGGRAARSAEADAGQQGARAGASALESTWRGATARVWVEGRRAQVAAAVLETLAVDLEALAGPVEARVRAGVEAEWEARLLEEAVSRTDSRRVEAEQDRAAARAELSALVGRCVEALPPARDPVQADLTGTTDPTDPTSQGPNPEVDRLHYLANATEARARAAADADRWNVSVVGSVGPTRSRAFDPDPVEQEYLVGVLGQFRLDLAGVQRQRVRAGAAEAAALREEAESLRASVERERARLTEELARTAERGTALDREVERSQATLHAARLRWEAGAGGWSPVLQALERRAEALLARATWSHATALLRIRSAELDGTTLDLPTFLDRAP